MHNVTNKAAFNLANGSEFDDLAFAGFAGACHFVISLFPPYIAEIPHVQVESFNMKKIFFAAALLALSACAPEPKRIVTALKPPPERLECQTAGTRPIIPPEHVIDWQRVVTAGDARAQHEAFVTKLREREGLITGYLVKVEGALFVCSNNAAWMRDFFAGLPD